MAFVKLVKTKAYFKRFQVKYRRRREGKTDYYARRKLVSQDKNKYNSPKYRLVVRFTNKDVIAQIAYSKIEGDHILCAAYSHELPRYGVEVGLTNYAACYATGLLLARRVLTKLKLAELYQGNTEAAALTEDGDLYHVEEAENGPRPFRCFLDVGLVRTSTGARVFGVMKGAVDGGLDIPHNEKRFPGYNTEDPKSYAEILRSYVYGGHVADYMNALLDDDEELYNRQFSQYIDKGVEADDIEEMYKNCHAKIRADPSPKARSDAKPNTAGRKRSARLTHSQRKDRVKQKKQAFYSSLNASQ